MPRSYLAASHDVLSGAVGRDEGFCYTSVHPSALVSKGVALLPPVHLEEGCEVGAGATVGGRTSLGRNCVVGEGAVVEASVLFDAPGWATAPSSATPFSDRDWRRAAAL